jgi:hypothetical protein
MYVLLAVVVALATTLPTGARAMPRAMGMTGTAMHKDCPNCPDPPGTGENPDKMPACQACVGMAATLPSPAVLPRRVVLRAAYLTAPPQRLTGALPAPDPFPPRPTVLV